MMKAYNELIKTVQKNMTIFDVDELWELEMLGYDKFKECIMERGLRDYILVSTLTGYEDKTLEGIIDDCVSIGIYYSRPQLFQLQDIQIPEWIWGEWCE